MSKASKLAPIDVDEANNNTSHNSEAGNVLGPLLPSAASFTPRFSMASRKSFTSEDYRREPEEAEGMEFRNVVPGQVAMVSVLSKFGEKGEKWRLKRVVADREGHQELEDLEEPSENDESTGKEETIGAEIQVNGEAYMLHEDGVFRPLNLCMSVKAHFKGYAVRANGIFKPLGGSPAAIDAGTLFRVTPTNKYSPAEDGQEHTSRALHRVKNVSQLLMRGTSGHEEYMYVYDPHWEGFVRTNETKRFPPEKAMLKPGDLRSSVHAQNSEELFASADEALRKANRLEEMIHRQSLPAHMHRQTSQKLLLRSLTLPSKKFVSPREAPEPAPQIPQTPAMFTKPIKEQDLRVDGEASWLNIDLPAPQQNSPIPNTVAPDEKPEGWENLHTVSIPPEIPSPLFLVPASNVSPPNDVTFESSSRNGDSISSSQVSPTAMAFRKPIDRVLGLEASQTTALYAPALQQLIDGCVLVLYFCGSQSSSRPRLARIIIPSSISPGFDDMDLFLKMHDEYQKLRGFWRRWISLKGLKNIDLIECRGNKRQIFPGSFRVGDCNFSSGKLLDNYLTPCKVAGDRYWVEWVRQLNSEGDHYALEFIEGWRSDKIIMTAFLPIALSITGGVLWCIFGPEQALPQEYLTAFVLGILVILIGWSIVGLLAVLSYTI